MTGLAEGMGRFGAVVGPLLVGFLMDKDVSINSIFILFMVSLIVGAIAVLALPDENLSRTDKIMLNKLLAKEKSAELLIRLTN